MNKAILLLVLPFAFAAAGCDRKAPDNTNPKTSAATPAQSTGTYDSKGNQQSKR